MSQAEVQYHKKIQYFYSNRKRVVKNQMLIILTEVSSKNYKENKKYKGYKSRNHLLLKGW